jgi:hypothetical protein
MYLSFSDPKANLRRYTVRQFIPPSDINTIGLLNVSSNKNARSRALELSRTPLQTQLQSAVKALNDAVITSGSTQKEFQWSLEEIANNQVFYFTDGGYTRCVARNYDDNSGYYLELIETGATDRKPAWSGTYLLQCEVCRILQTYITNAFDAEAKTITKPFKEVSILEQFNDDCSKHGIATANDKDCERMIHLAAMHEVYMVAQCNGEWPYGRDYDGETLPKVVDECRNRIAEVAKRLGAKEVTFGGDPRGYTVKIVWPDGFTNDFAQEGYCVPTSLKEDE